MSDEPLALEPASAAYESLTDELAALEPHEVLRVNVDVSRAASRALRAAPQIRELVPEMERHLPELPHERVLRLETYALAAWYAHACAWSIRKQSATKGLTAKARPLRDKLLAAADLFATAGFIDAAKIKEIRSGQGRLDRAKDMIALAALLEEAWPRIGSNTLITRGELRAATKLGGELLHAIAHGESALREQRAVLSDRCARAFTLLWRVYDIARRAVVFLRWEERDAETIAPSLCDNGGGRRRRVRTPTDPARPPEPAQK